MPIQGLKFGIWLQEVKKSGLLKEIRAGSRQ